MLERQWATAVHPDWSEGNHRPDFINLADIISFVRRYMILILAFMFVGLLLALFYLATSDRLFTARTQMLIEPRLPRLLQPQGEVNLSLDTAQIESQLALLRSRKIALMVINELDLTSNPAHVDPGGPSLSARLDRMHAIVVRALWPATDGEGAVPEPETASMSEQRAVEIFGKSLDIQRVGVSYAIDISFQSRDPILAARIANATADAFVLEQLETRSAEASEGLAWLENRIAEVGQQMNKATQDAQEFRANYDYSIETKKNVAQSGTQSDAPTLEQLEVTAEIYRKMYESLLSSYTSAVGQQPFLVANARIITTATEPPVESHPRKKLSLAFGALVGLTLGIGLAFAHHSLDRTVRSARQIRKELGLPCIAELPPQSLWRAASSRLAEVVTQPRSLFSANLRKAKTAISLIEPTKEGRSIGVTSVLPADGKNVVASNLAALFAASGMKTLLIDADPFSTMPTQLSRELVDIEHNDFIILGYEIKLAIQGQYHFLPNAALEVSSRLLPRNLQSLLERFGEYEMIIVNLPPFAAGSDGLVGSSLLDCVIIVARWGQTRLESLAELSRTLKAAKSTLAGVVVTGVKRLSTPCIKATPWRRSEVA